MPSERVSPLPQEEQLGLSIHLHTISGGSIMIERLQNYDDTLHERIWGPTQDMETHGRDIRIEILLD